MKPFKELCFACTGQCCEPFVPWTKEDMNRVFAVVPGLNDRYVVFGTQLGESIYYHVVAKRFASLVEKFGIDEETYKLKTKEEYIEKCVFYDLVTRECQIYDIRPEQCNKFGMSKPTSCIAINGEADLVLWSEKEKDFIFTRIHPTINPLSWFFTKRYIKKRIKRPA